MSEHRRAFKSASFIPPDKEDVHTLRIPDGFRFYVYLQIEGIEYLRLNWPIGFAAMAILGIATLFAFFLPIVIVLYAAALSLWLVYWILAANRLYRIVEPENTTHFKTHFLQRPKKPASYMLDLYALRPNLKVDNEEVAFLQTISTPLEVDFQTNQQYRIWLKSDLPEDIQKEYIEYLCREFTILRANNNTI